MPTYAYKCRDCGTPLEVHQEFSDAPLTVCPTCSGTLRKQYGSVGVTFNGSGFYRTDSRATTSGDGAGKVDAAKADSGKSESGKTDSGTKTGGSDTKAAPKPAAAPAS